MRGSCGHLTTHPGEIRGSRASHSVTGESRGRCSGGRPGELDGSSRAAGRRSPQQEQRPLREAVLGEGGAAGRLLHADDRVALHLLLPQVARQLRRLHLQPFQEQKVSPSFAESLKTPTRLSLLKSFRKELDTINENSQHHRSV